MLGLGIEIPKNNILNGFVGPLDIIGNMDSCVMAFSVFRRLTGAFNDDNVLVERSSDNATRWFGFGNDGLLETAELLSWVGGVGNYGYVERLANQARPAYPATQAITANKPLIVNNGVLCSGGIEFDGVSDSLHITKYADMNIRTPPLSMYINRTDPANTGFMFGINLDAPGNQYGWKCNGLDSYMYINNSNICGLYPQHGDQNMFCWFGTGANEARVIDDINLSNGTLAASPIIEHPNVRIGCLSNAVDGSVDYYWAQYKMKSILIFNTNQLANFGAIVAAGV